MDERPQSFGVNDLPNCQLIIIDKNNKIKFFKKCQIVITEGIKEIFFKPTDEDYKKINASFDRCFVCQGRIVCINSCEADPCKYVLIFRSKRVCSNIKALIEENNMNADAGTNVVNENYEEVFKETFLVHINNECENDEEMEKKLFMTRYDLNNYYKLMNESNATESTSTTDTPPTADENVDEEGNEFTETVAEEMMTPSASNTNQEEPANNNELHYEPKRNLRKRARKDKGFYGESDADNFDDLEDTDATTSTKKISPPSKRSKKNVQNFEGKTIIKTPDYQIMKEVFAGRNVKRLYVFDSADKKMCYKYIWNNFKKKFVCNSCNWKNLSSVWAKLLKDENGKEYIELGPKQHSCEIKEFQPQTETLLDSNSSSDSNDDNQYRVQEDVSEPNLFSYKIVTEKYGGRDVKHLYVFNENDKSLYYDLTWKQIKNKYMCNRCMFKHHINVWAKLVKDQNGKEILKQSLKEHQCELKQMNSMNNTI